MVKICNNNYDNTDAEKYREYFEKYPFPLSSFQKWAIESIVEGHHILVTAHTGSGKTLPAEFAIEHFVKKGKKVIYTSPIKALSNQKFYEFTQKFPHISFGILTGDIKTNPEADVLIMTTEILMNTLYAKLEAKRENKSVNKNLVMFDMDFENELECVIFDEVHYINDPERGKVWEETIMVLPPHIQMVMLSATLDSPEKFAAWCETRGQKEKNTKSDKIVYLTTTYERVVPLTHYSFITCTQGIFKTVKDKQLEMEIMRTTNTLHVVQDAKGNFNDTNFYKVKKILDVFEDKHHFVKRQHVLNTVARHLVDHQMLPALCFVLSRKALEQCAKEVTTVLLEDDSKVPYIVKRECEQIIRKLPNFQEYLQLPEYIQLVSLLEKGIAIHHAGMMPILREMVELLFAKGYVKLLFATETFAVGINMPTKTVLFTDITKFDGSTSRPLYSHEYTQMAGRAGRRGIDTIGHVIHLTNLFRTNDKQTLQTVTKGQPQALTSKFKVSYTFLLNLIQIGETDYANYTKRSLIQSDIDKTIQGIQKEVSVVEAEIKSLASSKEHCFTPIDIVEQYIVLQEKRPQSTNKKRKEIERELTKIVDQYKMVEKDVLQVTKYNNKRAELEKLNEEITVIQSILDSDVQKILYLLLTNHFITEDRQLTMKGQIATHLREVHNLVFARLIEENKFKRFTAKELIGIFSCFTNISVPDEKRVITPSTENQAVKDCIVEITDLYRLYQDLELENHLNTGIDYSIHFDLVDPAIQWSECETDIQCKQLLQTISLEKDIFLGEFIKAILKINNIANEMMSVAEQMGDMEFLSTLKQIPILTLKYVATNQSLYV
jgi:superfamily II RNA helicase